MCWLAEIPEIAVCDRSRKRDRSRMWGVRCDFILNRGIIFLSSEQPATMLRSLQRITWRCENWVLPPKRCFLWLEEQRPSCCFVQSYDANLVAIKMQTSSLAQVGLKVEFYNYDNFDRSLEGPHLFWARNENVAPFVSILSGRKSRHTIAQLQISLELWGVSHGSMTKESTSPSRLETFQSSRTQMLLLDTSGMVVRTVST